MVGDIFGDYGSASYDCAFAYGDVWHDDGFGSDPGFLFDADGFALDDPGVFEVVVDGEAMVDEAAFSYFHLAGEVELEGRQDGGGGGEYSLKEFIEALAHDGIDWRTMGSKGGTEFAFQQRFMVLSTSFHAVPL